MDSTQHSCASIGLYKNRKSRGKLLLGIIPINSIHDNKVEAGSDHTGEQLEGFKGQEKSANPLELEQLESCTSMDFLQQCDHMA